MASSTRLYGDPSPPVAAEPDDPSLTLPDVYSWTFKDGRWTREEKASWTIVTPQAKLVTKYTRGTSAIFSHYVFRFPHPDPDRITNVDITAADCLMGANISAQNQRRSMIESAECQDQLASVLRRIPVKASIEDASFDSDVGEAVEILIAHHGIKLAIATKLLCIKRPYLIPMMDSLVQDCFRSKQAGEILAGFRTLLALPEVSTRIDALASHLAAITGIVLSRVRILDELVWFDWNLRPPAADGICHHVSFPDWVYDTAHHTRGVYYDRSHDVQA